MFCGKLFSGWRKMLEEVRLVSFGSKEGLRKTGLGESRDWLDLRGGERKVG